MVVYAAFDALGLEHLVGGLPQRPPPAGPSDITIDEMLDRAVDNGDGTVTITITEAEASGLVRDWVRRNGDIALRDLDCAKPPSGRRGCTPPMVLRSANTVDLMVPDGPAPGQIRLNIGTFRYYYSRYNHRDYREQYDQAAAIIDLTVADGRVVSSVRDARLGPFSGWGEEIDQQLRAVPLLDELDQVALEQVRTTEHELVLTARRRGMS